MKNSTKEILMEALESMIRQIVREEVGERKLLSIKDFCHRYKISRSTLWRSIKSGETKTVSIGKRIFIDTNQIGRISKAK